MQWTDQQKAIKPTKLEFQVLYLFIGQVFLFHCKFDGLLFVVAGGDDWKYCAPIRDETDNCDVYFTYNYDSEDTVSVVQVQRTKRQPCVFQKLVVRCRL